MDEICWGQKKRDNAKRVQDEWNYIFMLLLWFNKFFQHRFLLSSIIHIVALCFNNNNRRKKNDEGRQRRKRRRKSAVCEKMIEIILSEYLLMCKGWSECIAIDCGSHKLGWIQNNWIIYLNLDCTRHRKWKSRWLRCTFYIAKPSADKRCYLLLLRTRPRGRALHNECLFSIIITVVGFTFIAASARILLQPL